MKKYIVATAVALLIGGSFLYANNYFSNEKDCCDIQAKCCKTTSECCE